MRMVALGAALALLLLMQIEGCASDMVIHSIPMEDPAVLLPLIQFTLSVNRKDGELCLHPLVARSLSGLHGSPMGTNERAYSAR